MFDILHKIIDHLPIHDERKKELHAAVTEAEADNASTDTRASSPNRPSSE